MLKTEQERVHTTEIENALREAMVASPFHKASIEDSKFILDALLLQMQQWLAQGRAIQLKHLGTFNIVERPARMIKTAFRRKGSSADAVAIGRRRNVTFRDGRALKAALRERIQQEDS